MEKEGTKEVTIAVKLREDLVKCKDGPTYHLDFYFGPSGAFFEPSLELRIRGKYVETGCHVWLFDANGEEVEGTRNDKGNEIIFEIPHFSSYSYDFYDEY